MLSNAHCALISTGALWKSLATNKSLYCKAVAIFGSNKTYSFINITQKRKQMPKQASEYEILLKPITL